MNVREAMAEVQLRGDVLVGQALRHQRHHLALPIGQRAPRDQICWLGVLDQESTGAGAQRLEDVLVELEGGEDDHVHAAQPGIGAGS